MQPSHTHMQPIHSLDDPRVAAYRNLKDRDFAREGVRFIAEGEYVVRRLLESGWGVESVLAAEAKLGAVAPLVPAGVPLYAASRETVSGIVGFEFHRGVLAIGHRRPAPSVADLARTWGSRVTLLVLPEITNTENLGALFRIAAGFGVDGVILGERCCDPLYRLCIRVSMGTVFRLPIARSDDVTRDLRALRDAHGVELAAAVLDDDAVPLPQCPRGERLGLLLGSEAHGLAAQHVALCSRRVTIPMRLGTDSLNVAVAAAVMLYEFTR